MKASIFFTGLLKDSFPRSFIINKFEVSELIYSNLAPTTQLAMKLQNVQHITLSKSGCTNAT